MDISAGDMVKTRFLLPKDRPKVGVVTEVIQHDPLNPIEPHGSVAVTFEDGSEEHYAHVHWFEFLKHVRNRP